MERGLTNGLVSVVIVSWNSASVLRRCLVALGEQTHRNVELIHIDNASADHSVAIVREAAPQARQIINDANRGFSVAVNQGVRVAKGEFVLLLNPDAFLHSEYVTRLVDALARSGETFGMATGKLLQAETGLVDSMGIRMTRSGRHFDIGQGMRDADGNVGRTLSPTPRAVGLESPTYVTPREIFGVSGAAAMYRMSFIRDVTVGGEFLDEDFFAFREDADVAWRGQLFGWRAIYVPDAVGDHVRAVTPGRRRALSDAINMHGVKNRFLLRLKNEGLFLALRNAPFELTRDLVVIAATLTVERSFPSGTGVAMEESALDHGETTPHPEPPPRLRPTAGRMVSLKIAIAGTRGIPPRYGGFETFAAELSSRLAARGHEVAVYCRDFDWSRESGVGSRREDGEPPTTDYRQPTSDARLEATSDVRPPTPDSPVERIVLPALRHKYLETVSHTLLSAIDALRRDFDVVLLCNAANAFVLPLLRAARIPVAINVDGIERHRRKWNVAGKAVYAVGESFSALFASRVVADANVIADYYRQRHGIEPVMIPYGAEFPIENDTDVLSRLGIESGNYILYVSRFEPENNPVEVVWAYERVAGVGSRGSGVGAEARSSGHLTLRLPDSRLPANVTAVDAVRPPTPHSRPPLVMLGSASYAHDLDAELRSHASERILFPGALYGADYRTLQRNALVYIQATEVGGTHPAMIEAMASGGCVLAHDTPENREVGGDAVGYFRLRPSETLSGTIQECLKSPAMREQMRTAARARAAVRYGWTAVTDAYERLFTEMAR